MPSWSSIEAVITDPNQPIEVLKGVGPSLQAKLARLGIYRTTDLLLHLPMRYQDRTRLVRLGEVRAQIECLITGHLTARGRSPKILGAR